MKPEPIPFSIEPHPYRAGRWTHLVRGIDARRRGWHVYGDLPLGSWSTKRAALRWARRLEERGDFRQINGGQA